MSLRGFLLIWLLAGLTLIQGEAIAQSQNNDSVESVVIMMEEFQAGLGELRQLLEQQCEMHREREEEIRQKYTQATTQSEKAQYRKAYADQQKLTMDVEEELISLKIKEDEVNKKLEILRQYTLSTSKNTGAR